MSRLEEVKELNENIIELSERYKDFSNAEARDIGIGVLINLLMKTNEMLAIITEDIEQKERRNK